MDTTTLCRIETVEQYTEQTQYGPLEVKARKVEEVVQWPAGNLELRVAFWRNGQRLPGFSDGNPQAIAEVMARAAAQDESRRVA